MPEQRFKKFKETLEPAQFDSVEYLKEKALALKDEDPKLSQRILVRVNNLQKQKQEQRKLSAVSAQPLEKGEIPVISPRPTAKKQLIGSSQQPDTDTPPTSVSQKLKALLSSPFILLVILPTLLFVFYQTLWASARFESQAQVIVQQPDSMATMDAGMALLSGMGVPSGSSDTELIKAYIYSNDMVEYLNKELKLREHYSQQQADYFSRIRNSDSREDFLAFYQQHISVDINDKSGVVTIYSQAFSADFAQALSNKIVERAEWYINSIGHQLAKAQLSFIQGEHQTIEARLQDAQTKLLNFQQQYNLLDPTAEGMAMQQISYTLEGQIASKQTILKTLKAIMSAKAPQVLAINNELQALKAQLKTERNKLAQNGELNIPVSEILAKFTDYKVKMELALQAYTSSQISLEKSRIEAYRQIKYLIVVEKSTLSEDNKYPAVFYNISLFLLLSSIVFAIGKIIITTIQELK